jgi:tetratricopeptide (TPR) repeat protein
VRIWLILSFCLAAWLSVVPSSIAADGGVISGVTRDSDGTPLPKVRLTLRRAAGDAPAVTSLSAENGVYRIAGLPLGVYTLLAELPGYTFQAIPAIVLSAEKYDLQLDVSAKSEREPGLATPAAPAFQSAGVRGLIDPGGYSAPAESAAAADVLAGVADLQRNQADAASVEFPCAAETSLLAEVEKSPSDLNANRKLGEFYLSHGNYPDAIRYLEIAREADGHDAATSIALTRAYIKTRQFDLASASLTKVRNNPSDGEGHSLMAQIDEGLGLFDKASAEYALAAAQRPDEKNLLGIGYEWILAGKPAQASKAFESALKNYPNSVELLLGSGAAEFLQGETNRGLDDFLKATRSLPADPRPYVFLRDAAAVDHSRSAELREAFAHYIAAAPADAEAFYGAAVVLMNTLGTGDNAVDLDQAKIYLLHAIQLKPNHVSAHFQLGVLYAEHDDDQTAVHEFQTVLRLDPTNREARYRLALAYKRRGDARKAAEEMAMFQQTQAGKSTSAADSSAGLERYVSVLSEKIPPSAPASCR